MGSSMRSELQKRAEASHELMRQIEQKQCNITALENRKKFGYLTWSEEEEQRSVSLELKSERLRWIELQEEMRRINAGVLSGLAIFAKDAFYQRTTNRAPWPTVGSG